MAFIESVIIKDPAGDIANVTPAGALEVDGSAVTQPVSATSLPLPTGAATAALQTQPGVDIGDVTINNAAGAAAVNIQDGGNSITVDGPLTDAQLRATPVPVAATITPSGTQDVNLTKVGGTSVSLGQQLAAASIPVILPAATITTLTPLSTVASTIADGSDVALGATTDAAVSTDTTGTVSGKLRGLVKLLSTWIGTLGQKTSANSAPVVLASDQSAIPVSGTVTVTPSGTQDTNLKQVDGATVNVGTGAASTGTQRVITSTDSTIGTVTLNSDIRQGTAANLNATVVQGTATNLKTQAENYQGGAAVGTGNPLQVSLANTGANTNKLLVTPDSVALPANQSVNVSQLAGTATDTNSGNKSAGTLRVVLATDQPAISTAGVISTKIDQTTDGTTNKVRATATSSFTDATVVVLAVTALQSLTSSATVGWQSLLVKNHVTKYNDFKIWVKLTTANTAPANDKAMYVYLIPWYTSDGGTTWNPSSIGTTTLPSGTDAAMTIASPHNLRLLGVLNYTTTQAIVQDTFLLSNAFGQRMPDGFSIGIINFSGAALSTGCVVDYTPINDTLI